MKNRFTGITDSQGFKAATLVVLTLIMLIPISMVKSLITERSWRAYEVKEEISESNGGALRFGGPVIKIPGKRSCEKVFINSEGNKSIETYEEDFTIWYTPDELDVLIDLDTENKFRGIFYSPVFMGELKLSGSFNLSDIEAGLEANEKLVPEAAEIIIPFFNQKGIRKINEAFWNGAELTLHPGSRGLAFNSGGIFAPISGGRELLSADSSSFSFSIGIRGAKNISLLPLAAATTARITADWPAPSFKGFCLPDSHNLTDEGFSAVWNCSSLSSGIPVKWDDQKIFDEYTLATSYIETDFINVHDHYGQNERAAKYAVLFILIPFITLFLFEHFFKRRIHIIQYILAGIANVIFYLLLLSLSEHISFNLSYLISAASVSLMLCLYTFSMLKKDRKAWFMAPIMICVYLFLFITLQSEDWALLIGSAGVFLITAFIMFITRKIDFYQSRQNQK